MKNGSETADSIYCNLSVGDSVTDLPRPGTFGMGRRVTRLALTDPRFLGGEVRARQILMDELRSALASGEVPITWTEMLTAAVSDDIQRHVNDGV